MSRSIKNFDQYVKGKELKAEEENEAVWPTGAEGRPCYRLYPKPFTMDRRRRKAGVYFHDVDKPKNAAPTLTDEWICGPLAVKAKTANRQDSDHGRLLEFESNGRTKKWSMPMELLAAEGDEILRRLLREGLRINYPLRRKVLSYISAAEPEGFLHCATQTGWHAPDAFVLPDEVIGRGDIWFQSAERIAAYAQAGSINGWKELVAARAVGNPFLMVALAFGLSGPLLDRLNFDGIGLHYYGDSTMGKTTVLSAAASLWGHGKEFRRTWRTTANGLEGAAVQYTDTLLVLDEVQHIRPADLGDVAYFVIDGEGKTRANKYGEARAAAHWRVAVLSSGEQSIRARMLEGGMQVKAGQDVRILDVPVSGEHGLFNQLHGLLSGAAFADAIRQATTEQYGYAGPAFVRGMICLDPEVLHKEHAKILAVLGKDLDPQRLRAAKFFALAALAGRLAICFGILPWSEEDITTACENLFKQWSDARAINETESEHWQILSAVRSFIDRHGDSRFERLKPPPGWESPMIRDRAGYWVDGDSTTTDPRLYLFTNSGLREATKGYDFGRVLKALDEAGAFAQKGSKQKSVATRTPTSSATHLYWINPEQLQ